MREIKFLHCADIHLDSPFTSLGAIGNKSSIRRQELKDTFSSIVKIAKKESVDLLLISGDLYEQEYVRKSTINFVNDMFKTIPETKVVIVAGNHDPYIQNSYYKNFKWADNVVILTRDNPYHKIEGLDTCVYGVGFNSYKEENSVMQGIAINDSESINILLIHGTIDFNIQNNNYNYNHITSDELSRLNMDYIAVGHFHKRSDDIGQKGNIFNPGSPEPLGFDEIGEHGIYLGKIIKDDLQSTSLDINFHVTNKRSYQELEVDLNSCNNDEQVIGKISNFLLDRSSEDLYSILLNGYTDIEYKPDIGLIQSNFKDKYFYIKIKNETTADYDFEAIKKEHGVRGLFTRKMMDLINKTEDECEKARLVKSLYYGLEAIDLGRIDIRGDY